MLDLVLWLGLIVVGTGVLWLVAKALLFGGGRLAQVLEWFVYGKRQE